MNTQSGQIEAPVATAADSNRSASKLATPLPKATRRTPKRPPVAVEGSGSPTNIPGEERMPGKATKTTKTKPASPASRLQQGRLFPEDDGATSVVTGSAEPKPASADRVPDISTATTSTPSEANSVGENSANPVLPSETSHVHPGNDVPGSSANVASDVASLDAPPIIAAPKPAEKVAAISELNEQDFRERDERIVLAAKIQNQPELWFIQAGRDLDVIEEKKLYRIEKFGSLEEYLLSRGLLMQTTGHWRNLARAYDEMVAAGYTPPTVKAVHFEAVKGYPVARKFQILTAASVGGRITEKRIEAEIARLLALEQPLGVEPLANMAPSGDKAEMAGNAHAGIDSSDLKTSSSATSTGPANGPAKRLGNADEIAARRATTGSVVTANSGRSTEFRSVASFSDDELRACKARFSVELTNQLLKMRQIAEAASARVGIHHYDAIEFFERMMKM